MNRQRVIMTLAVACFLILGGCNGNNRIGPGDQELEDTGMLLPSIDAAIPDVPLPLGFHLIESRSRHVAAGDSRMIDYLYKGRANKFSVARFYRHYMPNSRWQLVTDRFAQGTYILIFRKGSEECLLTVNGSGSWLSPTYISVQVIWTSSHVAAPMEPALPSDGKPPAP